jgi:membrane-bound acyltransferase YfiQ involved in biofilm formation
MNIVLLAVLAVGIWGIGLRKDNAYLSKEQTGAINGFFVLLVFLRHTVDYITLGPWDGIFGAINAHLDQLIVVPFLFYSGYGIMCSIRRKGQNYVSALPRDRLFKVWYHFAVAVALYLVLALCIGKKYGAIRIALSFTGWDSIGNSNWYIFATICMYLFTWLSFTVFRKDHRLASAALMALSVGYILIMRQLKGIWWYDTALVYPAGVVYGLYREKIETLLQKKVFLPWLALAICGAAFLLCFKLQNGLVWREGMAVAFALTVLCATMVFKIGNPILVFLGKFTFEIYILQRIPMILLKDLFQNQYVYLAVSFCLTLLLAIAFRKLLDLTDALIYKKGGKPA